VENWIRGHRKETEQGIVWGLANEAPDVYLHTLYAGSAGIAVFYLEMYQLTGESRYLEEAVAAGHELVAYVHAKDSLTCSCLGGWGGYMFVLAELKKTSGESTFGQASAFCAQQLRADATEIGSGIGWIAPMPYAKLTGQQGMREIYDTAEGAAGIGLYYLYAHQEGVHPEALTWAGQIADRLLEVAEEAEGGKRWQLMDDIPWPFDAPNFAHGTAGVAYFFARAYEAIGDKRYINAALAGAGHVQAMAVAVGEGHLVPHIMNDGREYRFYLGFCHGPAGTSRLFYLLNQITGDKSLMQWADDLTKGMEHLGAPEERGRGFWNNISQCCCDAGIGDFAVSMYGATGNEQYLTLAHRVADELLRRSEGDADNCFWPQAEHRTQPEFIQAQTGYMQGAAGVASFLMHLATVGSDNRVKIRFPESPFNR
jgi:lantibiotic modifying enzyme